MLKDDYYDYAREFLQYNVGIHSVTEVCRTWWPPYFIQLYIHRANKLGNCMLYKQINVLHFQWCSCNYPLSSFTNTFVKKISNRMGEIILNVSKWKFTWWPQQLKTAWIKNVMMSKYAHIQYLSLDTSQFILGHSIQKLQRVQWSNVRIQMFLNQHKLSPD